MLRLKGLGPKIVVITDGKNDIHAMDETDIYRATPPFVRIVDATGAGDAFASSFLCGILKKNDIEFAIKLGIINAMSVVTHFGAKNILLSYKEAMKAMKKSRIRIHKKKIK